MEVTFKLQNSERTSNFVENDNRTKRWVCFSKKESNISYKDRAQIFYNSYGDQITTKVSRFDLDIVGFIEYISKSLPVYFKYDTKANMRVMR